MAHPKPGLKDGTAYSRRPRFLGYLRFTRTRACAACGLPGVGPCDGRVEAAHLGPRENGGWRKGHDLKAGPLCRRHHRDSKIGIDAYGLVYVIVVRLFGSADAWKERVYLANQREWYLLTTNERARWDEIAAPPARRRAA